MKAVYVVTFETPPEWDGTSWLAGIADHIRDALVEDEVDEAAITIALEVDGERIDLPVESSAWEPTAEELREMPF